MRTQAASRRRARTASAGPENLPSVARSLPCEAGDGRARPRSPAGGPPARTRRSRTEMTRRWESVVLVGGEHGARAGVDLHVAVADVDVEDELALVVLEVDLADGPRPGGPGGVDGLLLGDAGLRQQVLAVVEPRRSGGRRAAAGRAGGR